MGSKLGKVLDIFGWLIHGTTQRLRRDLNLCQTNALPSELMWTLMYSMHNIVSFVHILAVSHIVFIHHIILHETSVFLLDIISEELVILVAVHWPKMS